MSHQDPPRPTRRSDKVLMIYDLFFWMAICTGIGASLAGDTEWRGLGGGATGALIGGWLKFILGRFPEIVVLNWLHDRLLAATSNELQDFLHQPDCPVPNIVSLELQRRGENIHRELGLIHALLVSEDVPRRAIGLAALNSAFPDLALTLCDYRVVDSVEECRRKTKTLRPNLDPA